MANPTLTVEDLSTGQITVVAGGIPGPQGPPGPAGGPQGPQGDQGPQGVPGDRGPQGVPGDRGPTGPQGLTGSDGQPGLTGAPGPPGVKGDPGPAGNDGSQGMPGDQGPQGQTGAPGPQGLKGDPGSPGTQGIPGTPGTIGPTGLTGAPGPQGTPGPQGIPGIQGTAGPRGGTGSVGPIGPQGIPGNSGPTGGTGPQGFTGPMGPQGVPGDDGVDGQPGPEGPIGPSGGPVGPQGDPGVIIVTHGTDGTVARPDAPIVYWQGPAVPLNASQTDFWFGSSTSAPQSYQAALTASQSYTDASVANLVSIYEGSDQPTQGEVAPPRTDALFSTAPAIGTGVLYGPCFKATKTEIISNVTVYGVTAASVAPTLVRVGLYTINSDGSATLVASTASDTTVFNAANQSFTRALSAPYQKTANQKYFIGLLVVQSSGTLPTTVGMSANVAVSGLLAALPALSYSVTGQSNLPASLTSAQLNTASTSLPVFWVS